MPVLNYTKQADTVSHVMSNATGSTVWHLMVPPLNNRVRKVKGLKGMASITYGNSASATDEMSAGYMCWLRLPQQAGVPGVTDYEVDNRRLWVPTPFVVANGAPLYMPTPWLKAVDISDQDSLWFGVNVGRRASGTYPTFMASFEWAEARELKA